MAKTKVSLTLDDEIVATLDAIEKNEGVKNSTLVNKVLRRFFKRPGKQYDRYRMKDAKEGQS